MTEVLRRLELRPAGGNHKSISRWVERLGFSTDHFDRSTGFRGPRQPRRPLREVLVEGSTYNRVYLKKRLYEEGVKGRKCEMCGQGELWQNRRMSLILDHINGVADDNRLKNLRIVCPNCAATLDTHCGRRFRLEPKACSLCGAAFQPRTTTHRYCSRRCGTRAPNPHKGVPQPQRRKVERPPHDQLLEAVREHGFVATGRKYGVSDNAIRGWICWYERESEAGRRLASSP